MIKQITEEQFLQLVGLLALAKSLDSRMRDIEVSTRALLEVKEADEEISGIGSPGHIQDSIYCGYSAAMLLEKLGIAHLENRPRKANKVKK